MNRIVLLTLTVALAFVVGCGDDEAPQTPEEAKDMAQAKLKDIKDAIADDDMDKANDVLQELKDMHADASEDVKKAIAGIVETAEKVVKGAEGVEGLKEGGENLMGGDE
ncbi:MAG: hypothetical protein KGY99_10200 [Phycisphaerae bacterium]|nr:hypothetical protein [Phycisphaerae bacterium]